MELEEQLGEESAVEHAQDNEGHLGLQPCDQPEPALKSSHPEQNDRADE